MSVILQSGPEFVLSADQVNKLWQETIRRRNHSDDEVVVRCVDVEEIHRLNKQYRNSDKPTNVLTFSYDAAHDIALCMEIAKQEASDRNISPQDYTALLLVHAFLHVTGMDHERSAEESKKTAELESEILQAAGFSTISL